MTFYIVENSDNVILGAFKKKKKAKDLVKIGKNRWGEEWIAYKMKLNNVESWVLAGGETYRNGRKRK
jgi:hypothetical protein